MEFDFYDDEGTSAPGHRAAVDPDGLSTTVVAATGTGHNNSESLECTGGSGVKSKQEPILFSDDDVVSYSDQDNCETNQGEYAAPQAVALSKIVYPTILALGEKVDPELRQKAESRCCDFFVKQITTKKKALLVYTILTHWFVDKSIIDEKSCCYVSVSPNVAITSTHMRKLMKVFHMVFKYEFKAKSPSYTGLAKAWGTKLPNLIESMYTYITPEKCMQICTPYLVKWKKNGLVARPIINATIEKANRVTQAHIERRERRQMQKKTKRRGKRNDVLPGRKKSKTLNAPSIKPTPIFESKITTKPNVPGIEGLSDEEDVTCFTPPPLASDDIQYDAKTRTKQSNDLTYEEYVKRADQADLINIWKAKQKYDSVDFKSISIDQYLIKRKTLLPEIHTYELRMAIKRDNLMANTSDTNTRWTMNYSDKDLDPPIDTNVGNQDDDGIDRRAVLTPIFPMPIDEAVRAETIDNVFQVLKNVLVYNINPEGSYRDESRYNVVSSSVMGDGGNDSNQHIPSNSHKLERITVLGNAKYGNSAVPKGIAKMIGNFIFDLVGFRHSQFCSDKIHTFNDVDVTSIQTVDPTSSGDPLFGTPTVSDSNISKDKRFRAFASRLSGTEYGKKLNTNRLINLFLHMERQCFRKSILQMQSLTRSNTTGLLDFHIEVVRHPPSVRSDDNLLELTLSCIGGSPIKAKYNSIKILESHFNHLKNSYILHQAAMLKAVLSTKEKVGIISGLGNISLDTKNRSVFLGYVFALVLRYEKLFSGNAGSQSAIPPSVFSVLKSNLDVDGECFASPLNHQLPLYFSAFEDIDTAFGSLGSFCNTNNIESGSWECNPPFDVRSVHLALSTIQTLLDKAEGSGKILTFTVFFADIINSKLIDDLILAMSIYKRGDALIKRHCYMFGFRHRPMDKGMSRNTDKGNSSKQHLFWEPSRSTRCMIFQSSKAFETLCKGDEKRVQHIINEIDAAFAHDLSYAKKQNG